MRFAAEDLEILERIRQQTGMFTLADTIRYVIRQYAQRAQIELPKPKPVKKPKRK